MSKKKYSNKSTVFENPLKILLILVPLFLSLLIGFLTMGTSDALQAIRWIMILMLFGLAFFPISSFIFKKSNSGGFFFGQSIGILTVSLISWTLGYIGILPFNRITITAILIIMTAVNYLIKPLRTNLINKLNSGSTIEYLVGEQIAFAVVFTLLCYFKGFLPNINGQEKFMDYGYIMSMIRSSSLPAKDMWLSGYNINYYYFGQFIYALIIKFAGIRPSIGYNLAMCSSIAISFALSYSIGSYLIETAKSCGLKTIRSMNIVCGLLCGFATTIFGNSHSFFYDENSAGNRLLYTFQKWGINVGKTSGFFYPESTRYIGHNPDSALIEGIKNGGDYTIEEFPFYSFLVGDLHAHVCSTMVVLTIIAVCIALLGRVSDNLIGEKNMVRLSIINPPKDIDFSLSKEFVSRLKTQWNKIINVEIVTIGILLGIAQMTNYWDFLIYFVFCAMVLLIVMTRTSNDFSTIPGLFVFAVVIFDILALYLAVASKPLVHVGLQLIVLALAYLATCYAPCALSRTALGMSFLFTVSHIVALSFNLSFDMISNTLAACVNHSSPFQLWILYGTHVFICITFLVFTIINKNYMLSKGKKSQTVTVYGISPSDHLNPVSKFFGERNLMDVFVCGMIVVGIMLLIAPEIFYVRDIYVGGYLRSNTMFKFTYAAFIILSLSMAYSIIRLFWLLNKKGEFSGIGFIVGVLFVIMLIVPAHYTGVSLSQRCGDITKENYKGLDGVEYLQYYSSNNTPMQESGNLMPYYYAIQWFNENVAGNPVILETYGDSYTDCNIVSAYTGLQTVCGWQTHEQLWRFHGIIDEETNLLVSDPNNDVWEIFLNPRHADINTVYTSNNPQEIQNIIDKYNIEYIIIGDLETQRHGMNNSEVIKTLGTVTFEYGSLVIVRVAPTSNPVDAAA